MTGYVIAFNFIGRHFYLFIFILYQNAEVVEAWVNGPSSYASAVEPWDWGFAKVEAANYRIYHSKSMEVDVMLWEFFLFGRLLASFLARLLVAWNYAQQ